VIALTNVMDVFIGHPLLQPRCKLPLPLNIALWWTACLLALSACYFTPHPFSYRTLLYALILLVVSDNRDKDTKIYVPHKSILQRISLCALRDRQVPSILSVPRPRFARRTRHLGSPNFSRHENILRQGAPGSVSGVRWTLSYPCMTRRAQPIPTHFYSPWNAKEVNDCRMMDSLERWFSTPSARKPMNPVGSKHLRTGTSADSPGAHCLSGMTTRSASVNSSVHFWSDDSATPSPDQTSRPSRLDYRE